MQREDSMGDKSVSWYTSNTKTILLWHNILLSSNVIEYSQAFDNPFVQKLMHEEFYWTSFYLLKVHLESCPHKVVSCPNENCNKTMTRNNLQAHVTTTCPWRILQCCHCSDLYPARKTKVNVFFVLLLKLIVITKSVEVDRVRKRPTLPPTHTPTLCTLLCNLRSIMMNYAPVNMKGSIRTNYVIKLYPLCEVVRYAAGPLQLNPALSLL